MVTRTAIQRTSRSVAIARNRMLRRGRQGVAVAADGDEPPSGPVAFWAGLAFVERYLRRRNRHLGEGFEAKWDLFRPAGLGQADAVLAFQRSVEIKLVVKILAPVLFGLAEVADADQVEHNLAEIARTAYAP